jgi:beta-lactamase superfamily II metal-dependent hydrolase
MRALTGAPGLDVYRTDRDGRVTLESDGARLHVRTER